MLIERPVLNSGERAADTVGGDPTSRLARGDLRPSACAGRANAARTSRRSAPTSRRVDRALGALREAKAADDFDRVPGLVDDVAETYGDIEPPPMLREEWATAVGFFRHQAENARSLLREGRLPKETAEQDARYDKAFSSITDYGVAHCGRVQGQLVP